MITYHHARFTGAYVATCTDCRFTCAYWEQEEELEHDCADYPDKD